MTPLAALRSRSSRRMALVLVTLVGAVALLAGACSSDDGEAGDEAPTTTTAVAVSTTSLDDVVVEGTFGDEPTVTFTTAFGDGSDRSRVISTGDGAAVEDGERVTVDYMAVDGNTGATIDSTFGATPQSFTMGGQDLLPIITDALVGQPVGSRVLVATDATATSGSWVLLTIDVRSAETIPTSASGTPVAPRSDLPTVTVGDDGVPTVATPEGDPPGELVVQPLIEGTGPAVEAGQRVTMHYTGMIWGSGEVFDTSWDTGPVDFPIGGGQVIAGFEEGLLGQPVGSRVMLVIPPDKGYGDEGNADAGIAGTDTLVFVVDLLAAS